jgi:hypothetical protein
VQNDTTVESINDIINTCQWYQPVEKMEFPLKNSEEMLNILPL